MNSMIDMINEFRMVTTCDDWNDHMNCLFDCCIIMNCNGEDIPEEWNYNPAGTGYDDISETNEWLKDYDIDEVVVFAHYIHHIVEILQSNDLDY